MFENENERQTGEEGRTGNVGKAQIAISRQSAVPTGFRPKPGLEI